MMSSEIHTTPWRRSWNPAWDRCTTYQATTMPPPGPPWGAPPHARVGKDSFAKAVKGFKGLCHAPHRRVDSRVYRIALRRKRGRGMEGGIKGGGVRKQSGD